MDSRMISPERLAMCEAMLDDGRPFKEVTTVTGVARETLCKYFPGRQWTVSQVARLGGSTKRTKP